MSSMNDKLCPYQHKASLLTLAPSSPSTLLLVFDTRSTGNVTAVAGGPAATAGRRRSSGCTTILRALSPRTSSMATSSSMAAAAPLPRSTSRTGSAAASPDSTLRSMNGLRDALPASSSVTSSSSSLATTSNNDDYGGSSSHSSHTQMAHHDPTSANAVAGPSNLARTPSPSNLQNQRYQNVHNASTASTASQPVVASPAPRNPLIDLIETEHAYVNDLASIIKVRETPPLFERGH